MQKNGANGTCPPKADLSTVGGFEFATGEQARLGLLYPP
jgi:hypothetical protein